MQSGHNEAETIVQTLKVLPPNVFEETMKQLATGSRNGIMKWERKHQSHEKMLGNKSWNINLDY